MKYCEMYYFIVLHTLHKLHIIYTFENHNNMRQYFFFIGTSFNLQNLSYTLKETLSVFNIILLILPILNPSRNSNET